MLASGRISRGRAWLGDILDVKPILGLDPEGKVRAVSKVRGSNRLVPKLLDVVAASIPEDARKVRFGVVHVDALDRAETMQGEIAAYIPTNLISITDGQVYLDQHLFVAGFRPAIDISRSVSRIGGQAQHPRIKEEAGRMKLDYLQFLELEVFTRFGARLEASMEAAIRRGRILREILKQDRLSPLSAEFQLAWLVAFNDGCFDAAGDENPVPDLLAALESGLQHSTLTLDSPREAWSEAVSAWLEAPSGAKQS
ncbi:MAG: DegV family protein [Gemmatimonadota bacterium]